MAVISMTGLTDAESFTTLKTGVYQLEVGPDTKVIEKKGTSRLQVAFMVLEGPDQDDTGTSPEGRKTFDFFQLDGLETHSDGGNYARARLKNFLEAAGIEVADQLDFDDVVENLRGATVIGKNKVKTDNLGEPQTNWFKYLAG